MKKIVKVHIVPILFVALFAYAEKIKIGFIGDSITIQNGATDSYPGQLATFLGDGYEVGNFGVSGRTMLRNGDFPIWNEPQFSQALAFQPDILFIFLGTNDSKPYNWDDHKDEFLVDYAAMIDTFMHSEHPPQEVWAVLPSPAFSVQWDIRDSVIVNDIIPKINQIVADSGLKSIDFYNAFIDKRYLFPDDIHPSVDGSEAMALVIYEALTGKTPLTIRDVNVCKNKETTDGAGTRLDALVDGDPQTGWNVGSTPSSAYIDLGGVETVDAFVVQFPLSRYAGIQYTIEGAVNPGVWTPLADRSLRDDTLSVASTDTIVPTELRYLKLTVTGTVNPDSALSVSEFQALRSNGSHHPPAITPWLQNMTTRLYTYQLLFTPISHKKEVFKVYYRGMDESIPYKASIGFKDDSFVRLNTSMKPGVISHYYVRSFLDGAFVLSDTLTLSTISTTVQPDKPSSQPVDLLLDQNYPNPFNPETMIPYTLQSKGWVSLSIYDLQGRRVRSLVTANQNSGLYAALWDGRNDLGHAVSSGIYFFRLTFQNPSGQKQIVGRKMSLVR